MEEKEFVIKAKMNERWIPHFLGMLNYMEQLGNWGGSRLVSFISDGDGDFRPKFSWNVDVELAKPIRDNDGDRIYDAG